MGLGLTLKYSSTKVSERFGEIAVKVLLVHAWGPESNSQHPVKNQAWCILEIPELGDEDRLEDSLARQPSKGPQGR